MAKKTAAQQQKTIPDLLTDLAKKVGNYRHENQVTQSDLAAQAGVSFPIIGGIENQTLSNIQLDKLINVANAVGATVEIVITDAK